MESKDDLISKEMAWELIQFTQTQAGGEFLDMCKNIDDYIKFWKDAQWGE